ncbi:hypothetical protein fugu_010403 [Takifugu bimaculatus]|uniref:VWFA domain-containing protein n=1 Tax=Takifugu bimaculatus TaxID=433685 RepID=A0A4Z2CFC2_9TELE|nr:hypothetical protein fugu_010403 [Takifugu bimaculatus]
MDLVFVIDGSKSMGPANFELVKHFVISIVESLNVSQTGSHVGLLQYSTKVRTEFTLRQHTSAQSIRQAVSRMQYMGRGSMTGSALRHMFQFSFSAKEGARPNVPHVGIVFTDGRSQDDVSEWANKAKKSGIPTLFPYFIGIIGFLSCCFLPFLGVTIYAVGVGKAIEQELREIASEPDEKHLYYAEDFQDMGEITKKLKSRMCTDKPSDESMCQCENMILFQNQVTEKLNILHLLSLYPNMGCSSSSAQTVEQEKRPGTKPEESNGDTQAVRNGLLAEEAQTIEDQLQLPVQTALPEDLQPVTDNETQDVLLATEAQEDLCFHEDKDPWMEDVAPVDPAEICAELEASEEAVETLPQEDAGPIETPLEDASIDQPLNEATQKEPEFVAMLTETVALVEEVSAETAPEVTIGSAETAGSEPLEALIVEEEAAVVTSDQAAGPGTTKSTEPVLSGPTEPGTTEPTEPGSSETTDLATAEPTEPVPDEEAEQAPTAPTEPAPSEPTDLETAEPTEPVPGDNPEQAPIIQTESGPSDEAGLPVSETTEMASSESAGPVPNEAVGPESSDKTDPAPSEDRGPTIESMEPSPES